MKFLKALAITTVVSLFGVINGTYAQAMTFEELYEIKNENLNIQSFTQGSPFALYDANSEINAFLNLALINTYLSEDEHGGVFIDGDTLVVIEVVEPTSDRSRTNSMERIQEFANTESRILSNFLRIEEGRFTMTEMISTMNYIVDIEHIMGDRGDVVRIITPMVRENTVRVGILPHIYNDEDLRNEIIGYLRERVSHLSDKENFSDILSFEADAGVTLLGVLPNFEDEIWEYSEILEQNDELVVDNFNTTTIFPGLTLLRNQSGVPATANNILNGRLISTGHAFRVGEQLTAHNQTVGTVVRNIFSGDVDASATTITNPNMRVSNMWPNNTPIAGNSGIFNVSGASIISFGGRTGQRSGTILDTQSSITFPGLGTIRNVVLTDVTTIMEGDSGGPVRTSQGFNSGIITGVRTGDGTNRMVYVCIQRAANVL